MFVAYLLVCAMVRKLACVPRARLLMMAAAVLPIALLCASCGGGSSSAGTTNPPPPAQTGTPQGAFTITVTGTAASLKHTTNVMLKVN
jgi:hypothetical protein